MAGADVVVVGGGVVGCAVAYELARAGARVVVLERDQVASGASSAAAGMLVPLAEVHAPGPFFDFCLAGLRRFDAVVEELRAESGVEVEYVRSGLLKVAFTAEQEAELRAALTWQQARGLAVTWLDRQDALALEPKVSEEVRGALFTTEGGHVNAERLTQALAQAAARKGAMVLQGKAVIGFVVEGSRVVGVRLPDEVWSADHVVVAAGAWTAETVRWLGVDLPIVPVRGQILALRALPKPVQRIVFGPRGYLVPRVDGTITVGATMEWVGFHRAVTVRGLASLLDVAAGLVPALHDAEVVRIWAGLRPGSSDQLPILGPLPGWDGVSVASGHFRNGILLGPLTGQVVAEMVLGKAPSVPVEPFSPARFHGTGSAAREPAPRGDLASR